jgi:hypothetical protein
MRDALGNETRIGEYEHQLLPTRVKDAADLETTAAYNYRILQPARMTDPNGTSTHMVYNPIGLPLKQFVRGTDAQGNETLGGTAEKPEISFLYDFLHFEREGNRSLSIPSGASITPVTIFPTILLKAANTPMDLVASSKRVPRPRS